MKVRNPQIVRLLIGRPQNHAPAGEPEWITAIFREAVSVPVNCSKTGFVGDEVADHRFHGGPDKAVLVYAASHYPKWREELALPMEPGGFGENLCVDHLDEYSVCIGDVYRIGAAEVQVTQPRGPCSTLARRWGRLDLVRIVKENHRSGWYVRILREGTIAVGDSLELIGRPHPEWSVARTAQVNYSRDRQLSDLRELVELPELSMAWKKDLRKKLNAIAAARP
jgi:MOSC domain-containing protein YiiM